MRGRDISLTSESVQGTSLAFQGIDDVHGGNRLSLGVLGVGDCISDHIFQEDLEDTSGLFIDESADSLDSTSASQSTDGGLRDTLDIVTKNLPVTLSASLSKTFASFTTSRHLDLRKFVREFKAIRESNVDCKALDTFSLHKTRNFRTLEAPPLSTNQIRLSKHKCTQTQARDIFFQN